ncbi:hypothetical protein [Aporhodopirellula aestuarii]|uniref:Uncharacterized protein n=1 Tax=Aporhodopirellula aestuarii TaxID=2950107 RepID=A0ABT0UCF1_9BACT|nr:hypothetical protein [Aporhodopirellula aestuarii]MCM2374692.1 hypothetical protein [Aporhodopirellula aestuarii]
MTAFLPSIIVNGSAYLIDEENSRLIEARKQERIVKLPRLKMQEIPYDASDSSYSFQPSDDKPFVITNGAGVTYGPHVVRACLAILQQLADEHDGLDYLQVFEDPTNRKRDPLWFIEDGDGGAISALLPSDY